jgi:hypothetical protein
VCVCVSVCVCVRVCAKRGGGGEMHGYMCTVGGVPIDLGRLMVILGFSLRLS